METCDELDSKLPIASLNAVDLPYPEYSILDDGSEGAFLPQLSGQAGADRVYRGWAVRALEADKDSGITLRAVFEHLQSTFTPPPGIPAAKAPADLFPYLPSSADVDEMTTIPKASEGNDGHTIHGYRLRRPTFEEMSDVWKSVGMSLLRWALAAFERDRADSQERDEGSQKAGSSRSHEPPEPTINSHTDGGVGVITIAIDRSVSATDLSVEGAETQGDGIPTLPDSAFIVTAPASLPFPEICVRRNLEIESSKGTRTSMPDQVEQEPVEPIRMRKKALYAQQRFGVEGSKSVALAWLNAVTVREPGEDRYTRLDSVFQLYRAYAYHPFRCPPLDREMFDEVLLESARMGTGPCSPDDLVTGLSSGHQVHGDGHGHGDGDGDGDVVNRGTGSTVVNRDDDVARPRPRLIRASIRPPDKVLQKAHEAIWESIGLNWKKARGFDWDEHEILRTRQRDKEVRQRRQEEKKRIEEARPDRDEVNTGRPAGRPLGVIKQVEVRSKVVQVPGRIAPDFVTVWLAQTYRSCPPGRATPQRELWQAYTQLVHTHSTTYTVQLEQYAQARHAAVGGRTKAEWDSLGVEGERLGRVHAALTRYIAWRPADVFELVVRMFGAALRRMEDGSYGLDGLERVRSQVG